MNSRILWIENCFSLSFFFFFFTCLKEDSKMNLLWKAHLVLQYMLSPIQFPANSPRRCSTQGMRAVMELQNHKVKLKCRGFGHYRISNEMTIKAHRTSCDSIIFMGFQPITLTREMKESFSAPSACVITPLKQQSCFPPHALQIIWHTFSFFQTLFPDQKETVSNQMTVTHQLIKGIAASCRQLAATDQIRTQNSQQMNIYDDAMLQSWYDVYLCVEEEMKNKKDAFDWNV